MGGPRRVHPARQEEGGKSEMQRQGRISRPPQNLYNEVAAPAFWSAFWSCSLSFSVIDYFTL